MNGLPYYPRYPRDFFDGTNRLSFELKGAYSMLLDLIYMSGGELYDEARFIAGHMNCSVRSWNKYRTELIHCGKIKVENGIISNFRADKELIIQRSFQDKQRENRLGSRKNNDLPKTTVKPKHNHTDTDTDKKEEIGKPISIMADHFDEFWQAVPRKAAKEKARQAFTKASKAAAPEIIIAAMRRYADQRNGQDPQYTAHPASWLNAGRWTDEPEQTQTIGAASDRNSKGERFMRSFLAGAVDAPRMDVGQNFDPPRPLLARG